MKRTFILVFLLVAFDSLACECTRIGAKSFTRNIKDFELIVQGTLIATQDEFVLSFVVIEFLKGEHTSDTLILHKGSVDCNSTLSIAPTTELILGLNKSPFAKSSESAFVAPGCITAVLYFGNDGMLTVDEYSSDASVKKSKITPFKSKLKFSALRRKMKT